jgi:hypothetical protein
MRRAPLSLDSFRPDGFVGIGVPIGTDNFVRQFVAKKYRDIIEDVEKLDAIEDSFIHFQLLTVNLSDFYSYRIIGKLTAFFAASGVQSAQSNLGSSYFNFRRAAFSSMLKSKCGNILAKASALRVNLNLDGAPIASNSHTHPSHSQTGQKFLTHQFTFLDPPIFLARKLILPTTSFEPAFWTHQC